MSGFKKFLLLVVFVLLAGYVFAWSGIYNMAANDKHWWITSEIIEYARDQSVSRRAEDIVVPDLADIERVKRGAANYDAMCVQCHLAPGIESSELHEGLYPKPPLLYKDDDLAGESKEVFWVIKNGIKMTGMPAWGISNSDEQIWDMIALITALDQLGEKKYRELVDSGKHTHKGDAHAGGGMPDSGSHAMGSVTELSGDTGEEKNAEKNNPKDHNDDGHSH